MPQPEDIDGWRRTFVLLSAIVVLGGAVSVGAIVRTVGYWEARAEDAPPAIERAVVDRPSAIGGPHLHQAGHARPRPTVALEDRRP